MIDWSSSCGLVSDSRKRMQQMVSRANVPRTMMPTKRLTEPEQRELERESQWEQWKLESDARWEKRKLELLQQSEARWEKMMQQLRNIISPKPVGEVAVVDNESNRASLVEEVDLQYEARRHQSEARFQEHMQQSMAAMDLDSDSRESHSREGEVHMNTDHDPVEVAVIPLQKTEEMQLSMPLPHNWKSTEVNGIDSKIDDGLAEQLSGVVEEESIMLGNDAIANSDKEFGNYWNFSSQFCLDTITGGGKVVQGKVRKGRELEQNKLKGTERVSQARENAPMSEFDVVFPILAGYSLSLSWLLNWFPRPTVKLKFVAQCDDELYEGFDGRRNGFLGCGGFSISEDREHLGIQGENGYALVEMQPDQRSGDPRYSAGVFDGVYSVSYFGGNVLGDGSYPLGSVVPGVSMVSRKGPCSKRKSSPASIFTLLKEIGGLGHVHMGDKAVALVLMDVIMVPFAMKVKFLTSLANRVFDGGGFNGAVHIDALLNDALVTTIPNLECSLYESANMQRYNKLLVDASWKLVDKSMVVERVSIMSVKDALAIYVEEFGNSRSFSLHFGDDARAGKRLNNGKVRGNELEQYVAAFSNYKTCFQAKKLMETECLANACQNAQLRELATILSVIRNLKRLFVRFPKPMVKMRLVLILFCELLREADMLGVSRIKVVCQGSHAWGLEQGLRVNASKALPSSTKETMAVRDVLNSTLDEEIAPDSKVLVKGEEVGKYHDAYKLTKGLLDKLVQRRGGAGYNHH